MSAHQPGNVPNTYCRQSLRPSHFYQQLEMWVASAWHLIPDYMGHKLATLETDEPSCAFGKADALSPERWHLLPRSRPCGDKLANCCKATPLMSLVSWINSQSWCYFDIVKYSWQLLNTFLSCMPILKPDNHSWTARCGRWNIDKFSYSINPFIDGQSLIETPVSIRTNVTMMLTISVPYQLLLPALCYLIFRTS